MDFAFPSSEFQVTQMLQLRRAAVWHLISLARHCRMCCDSEMQAVESKARV